MKKFLSLLLAAAMIFALVSCGNNQADDVTVRVAALKGPTGMGMVQLMENDSLGTTENDYEFTIAASPEENPSSLSSVISL
jgi:NitT/TauT family transport system substrate-binding protein